MLDGEGGVFLIRSGPGEDAKDIAELTVVAEDMSDEEIMALAGTLSSLAKMMLIELGIMDETDLDPAYSLETKHKLH